MQLDILSGSTGLSDVAKMIYQFPGQVFLGAHLKKVKRVKLTMDTKVKTGTSRHQLDFIFVLTKKRGRNQRLDLAMNLLMGG